MTLSWHPCGNIKGVVLEKLHISNLISNNRFGYLIWTLGSKQIILEVDKCTTVQNSELLRSVTVFYCMLRTSLLYHSYQYQESIVWVVFGSILISQRLRAPQSLNGSLAHPGDLVLRRAYAHMPEPDTYITSPQWDLVHGALS